MNMTYKTPMQNAMDKAWKNALARAYATRNAQRFFDMMSTTMSFRDILKEALRDGYHAGATMLESEGDSVEDLMRASREELLKHGPSGYTMGGYGTSRCACGWTGVDFMQHYEDVAAALFAGETYTSKRDEQTVDPTGPILVKPRAMGRTDTRDRIRAICQEAEGKTVLRDELEKSEP